MTATVQIFNDGERSLNLPEDIHEFETAYDFASQFGNVITIYNEVTHEEREYSEEDATWRELSFYVLSPKVGQS